MPGQPRSEGKPDQPLVYQIRIQGHLNRQPVEWLEEFTVTLEEDGMTLLSGPVIDQAALHGILKRIRDLGLPLLSVNFIESSPQDTPGGKLMPPRI